MRILGVDPGGKGALALLEGRSLEIEDMPVFTVKRGRTKVTEMNVPALIDIIAAMRPDYAFFEKTGGHEGEAAKAAYNFGRIAGACEAIVKSSGAEFHFIAPHLWKKRLGIQSKENGGGDAARAKACDLWPAAAKLFARKMDDGRADAALIAWFGREQCIGDRASMPDEVRDLF